MASAFAADVDGLRQRRPKVDANSSDDAEKDKSGGKPMKKNEKWIIGTILVCMLLAPCFAAWQLWYHHGIAFHETFGHAPKVHDPHAPEVGNMDALHDFMRKRIILMLGGPHRGGTTVLWDALSYHPNISGFAFKHKLDRRRAHKFEETFGEGIFLQTVYPKFGLDHKYHPLKIWKHWFLGKLGMSEGLQEGIGRYAFHPDHHMTEDNPLVNEIARARLWGNWHWLWDTSQPVLMEKSPSNMMITRFLHALWGKGLPKESSPARFIMMTRHPLAVALATKRAGPHTVRDLTIYDLVHHWLHAEETMESDLKMLPKGHWLTLKLETFTDHPADTLRVLYKFLGLPEDAEALSQAEQLVELEPNGLYEEQWCRLVRTDRNAWAEHRGIIKKLGERIKKIGYDMDHFLRNCPKNKPKGSDGTSNDPKEQEAQIETETQQEKEST
eukprot:gnl/MRDRNA2_/MRDRNA2_94157_c0_seq1.p1 gnl/MRDRNA2_/MRDRNA2_94157_c0~~gnl/MRDRNA2_/MRDRNA2_94157_c0_seq1.p1  ORF type:complete len:441 (+),score=80.17 gnl/MRDRNA2_/MRDRNA2_94157_c0_seq1:76-1398(+)